VIANILTANVYMYLVNVYTNDPIYIQLMTLR